MEELKLNHARKIVFLTGAGVSQESGIKTFRDANGLWENHSIHEVATPEAFRKNPELVQRFYDLRREQLDEVEPNNAHKAIGKLSSDPRFEVTVITQNVDDLHERGGAKKVLHMHGELRKIRNLETGEVKAFQGALPEEMRKNWRPDIVWFGEQIKESDAIMESIHAADLFITVGTSSEVYPAAGLFEIAKGQSATTVELNLEKTQVSSRYCHSFQGKASRIVPEFIKVCLGAAL